MGQARAKPGRAHPIGLPSQNEIKMEGKCANCEWMRGKRGGRACKGARTLRVLLGGAALGVSALAQQSDETVVLLEEHGLVDSLGHGESGRSEEGGTNGQGRSLLPPSCGLPEAEQ